MGHKAAQIVSVYGANYCDSLPLLLHSCGFQHSTANFRCFLLVARSKGFLNGTVLRSTSSSGVRSTASDINSYAGSSRFNTRHMPLKLSNPDFGRSESIAC